MNPQRQINFNVISEAYNIVKDRWQQFVLAGLLASIVIGIAYGVMTFVMITLGFLGGNRPIAFLLMLPIMAIFVIVICALASVIQAGLIMMGLKSSRKEPADSGDVFFALKAPLPFLMAGAIIGLAVAIGSICIAPGLIVAGLTMFTYPLMVDQKMAPIDAIKTSIETLKSQWLMATIFILVAGLVSAIGAVACGVGIFFTLPIGLVAVALCYRDLTEGSSLTADVPEPAPAPEQQIPSEAPATTEEQSETL